MKSERESVVSYRDQSVKDVYEKLKRKHAKEDSTLDFVKESSSESQSGSESDRSEKSRHGRTRRTYTPTRASVDQKNMMVSMVRPSILSTEYTASNPVSFKGLINLALTMLVVSHLRLILENAKKYGFMVNTVANLIDFVSDPSAFPSLQLAFCFNFWIAASYLLEKYLVSLAANALVKFQKQKQKVLKSVKDENESKKLELVSLWRQSIKRIQAFAVVAHFTLLVSLLVIPIIVIFHIKPNPVSSVANCMLQTILILKLISYAAVNYELRDEMIITKPKDGPLRYPQNITLGNIYYFSAAPTLVYEQNFPRTKEIRWGFLAKRVLELVLFSTVMVVMVEQYIVPLVKNSMMPMKNNDALGIFERLLKLTIPNIVVWVLMFYVFFHSFLNIVAELLRYGDRLFYLEWWNATTMAYFWRTWNKPVNAWMVRHIYMPLLNRGYSQGIASFFVFFVSGVFHEYCVSIPFRSVKLWAFSAMMLQLPLSYLTRKYTKGKMIGNILFWASFMFGQSNCILLYYYDFVYDQKRSVPV